VEQPAVQELVGEELPQIKFLPNKRRHQAKKVDDPVTDEGLEKKNGDVDDQ